MAKYAAAKSDLEDFVGKRAVPAMCAANFRNSLGRHAGQAACHALDFYLWSLGVLVLPAYRTDIDGLRAIAVLSVLGFHAFPKQFSGGFIGVDIFFVISGFLISNIIYQDLQAGEFSFVNFYARRIRRIFPALIVVLIACMIAGWFVLFQDEFRSLGTNVAAAAGFVTNFVLVEQAGYFGPAAEATPLLHLWSLGIEEQYYLVWPLLVVLSWRYRFAPLAVAGVVFAVSFASNVILVRTDQVSAFYLPVTRFWELMLGCGLSFVIAPKVKSLHAAGGRWVRPHGLYSRYVGAVHETAALLGIALIVSGLLFINRDRLFPGWWALLPTVGTALLIFAGPATSINRTILSRDTVVRIGLISYPLYLWHWPILVFERAIRVNEPTDLMKLAGVGAAFVLADQTYRWIEKPIRFGASAASKSIAASMALVATGCLGLLIYGQDGFPQRVPDDVRALSHELGTGSTAAYRLERCFLSAERSAVFAKECDGGPAMPRKIVLWGDSHAAHLYPGLRTLEQERGDFTLAQYTASGCPPVFAFASDARKSCRSINDFVARKIAELDPEIVVMAARWELYDGRDNWGRISAAMIRATVNRLAAMGVNRIVVIGQFPVWEAAVPRIRIWRYRMSIAGEKSAATERDRAFPQSFKSDLNWNDMVRRAVDGTAAIFVSPLSTFCNDGGCLLAVPGSEDSVAWDQGHLTPAASDFFVESNARTLLGNDP